MRWHDESIFGSFIHAVVYNRRANAVPRTKAENVRTMSGQPACHKSRQVPIGQSLCDASTDKKVCWSLPGRIFTNVETTEQVSKGEVKFTIRQAIRDRLISFISGANSWKFFSAYFMPRQLRGPLEKLMSQASRALESGWSHRSGINSYGREKISSENETKTTLWLTTLYQEFIRNARQ